LSTHERVPPVRATQNRQRVSQRLLRIAYASYSLMPACVGSCRWLPRHAGTGERSRYAQGSARARHKHAARRSTRILQLTLSAAGTDVRGWLRRRASATSSPNRRDTGGCRRSRQVDAKASCTAPWCDGAAQPAVEVLGGGPLGGVLPGPALVRDPSGAAGALRTVPGAIPPADGSVEVSTPTVSLTV
jgi:hypothetical protein